MAFIKCTFSTGIVSINPNEVQFITIDAAIPTAVKVVIDIGLPSMTTPITITETSAAAANTALASLIAAVPHITFTTFDGKVNHIKKSSISSMMITPTNLEQSSLYFTFIDVGFPSEYRVDRTQANTLHAALHVALNT